MTDWLWQQGIGGRPVEGRRGFSRTSNWRGYIAIFLIHGGRLWIEGFKPQIKAVIAAKRRDRWIPREDGKGEDREVEYDEDLRPRMERINPKQRPFTFQGLFPTDPNPESPDPEDPVHVRDEKGRVRADWYSGELRIPMGEMLKYVHGGYGSEYEQDRLVLVQAGVVVRDWVRGNE